MGYVNKLTAKRIIDLGYRIIALKRKRFKVTITPKMFSVNKLSVWNWEKCRKKFNSVKTRILYESLKIVRSAFQNVTEHLKKYGYSTINDVIPGH